MQRPRATGASTLPPPRALHFTHRRALRLAGRPLVMGVLNVTPDSFSDGGRWLDPGAAVARAVEMIEHGAELLDLGAESTRPAGSAYGAGAATVDAAEEWSRLEPVLTAVRALTELPISVDTRKSSVAERALGAGADLINDITALADPASAAVVARAGCPVVLMHSRGELDEMQHRASYDDVVREVAAELSAAAEHAVAAGVDPARIVVDPGIGFAKTAEHNLALLRHLDVLGELGYPLLVGASRKAFIGSVTGTAADDRLPGSLAAVAWAATHKAAMVRVHDVRETRHFLEVWDAIDGATR